MNTALMGTVNEAFEEWKAFIESDFNTPVGEVMRRHAPGISAEEIAAYEARFQTKPINRGFVNSRLPLLLISQA